MAILETERLILDHLHSEVDASFILRLVNEPSWVRFVGDRGVRTEEDARRYLENGPVRSYETHGFGFYRVRRKLDDAVLGMCGIVQRDGLEGVDLGFAFLPEYWGKGYAQEASQGVIQHAKNAWGLQQLWAICTADNERSIRLLEKLGFTFEKTTVLPGDDEVLQVYVRRPEIPRP